MKKIIKTIGIVSLLLSMSCAKETLTQVDYIHDTVVVKEIDTVVNTVIEPKLDTIINYDTLYITDSIIIEKNDTITITVKDIDTVIEYKYVDVLTDFSLNSNKPLKTLTHSTVFRGVVREVIYTEDKSGDYNYIVTWINDYGIDYTRKCYYLVRQVRVMRYVDGSYYDDLVTAFNITNSKVIFPCTFIE